MDPADDVTGLLHAHTLQPTDLVHEAYLRLVNQQRAAWRNRAQFFGVAAEIMRRVLVDRARAHLAAKRSGRDLKPENLPLLRGG